MSEPHPCHFCGTDVIDGYEPVYSNDPPCKKPVRHWLSDCRPDLVKHEIGPDCTWAYRRELPDYDGDERLNCYGYQEGVNGPWTDEHIHFYEDGPC